MEDICNRDGTKILFVQPGRGIGGAKISLLHLIKALNGRAQIHLALSAPVDDIFVQLESCGLCVLHTLPFIGWFRPKPKGILHQLLALLRDFSNGWYLKPSIQLALIIKKYHIDLVHTNSSVTPIGAISAKLAHRPHIWHIREPIGSGTDFKLKYGDFLTALIIKKLSSEIVCISEYTAQFFMKYGIKPVIIQNGININEFKNMDEKGKILKDSIGIKNSTVVIGMVGSLHASWKEHDIFLYAMRYVLDRYPKVRFFIFGGTSNLNISEYTRTLNQLVKSLNMKDKVFWLDYSDDISAMMSSLDVVVHPVSKEGSGRVIMEAMAAGKPVVTVSAGGAKELVQNGVTGYVVDPKDPKALGAAVLDLISNIDHMKQIGEQAKAYAESHFAHEKTVTKIVEIYDRILHKNTISNKLS